jgi:hypothetical protein
MSSSARAKPSKLSSEKRTVMSPAERRRLIEAPFSALGVHRFGHSYPWSGVLVERDPFKLRSEKQLAVDGDITKFSLGEFADWNEVLGL